MKLTDWFDGVVAPARVGVYERYFLVTEYCGYAYWNGKLWYAVRSTKEGALAELKHGFKSYTDWTHTKWRGLADEPKQTVRTNAGVFAG